MPSFENDPKLNLPTMLKSGAAKILWGMTRCRDRRVLVVA